MIYIIKKDGNRQLGKYENILMFGTLPTEEDIDPSSEFMIDIEPEDFQELQKELEKFWASYLAEDQNLAINIIEENKNRPHFIEIVKFYFQEFF